MEQLRIALCQLKQGRDYAGNLARAEELVCDCAARGAGIAVLPEMFITPYEPAPIRGAVPHAARAAETMATLAREKGMYVVAGSLPWEMDDGLPRNRTLVFDPQGDIACTHDKIHLFDCNPPGGPQVRESQTVSAGSGLQTFITPWGKAAILICYDLRFTPLIQLLAAEDVRLLFVPAAFSLATGKAHWEMLVRMRAIELQGFVVGVQPATNPRFNYVPWGHSLVADPWGEVLWDAGPDEALGVVDLDMTRIDAIRERFPLKTHLREDLYTTDWRGRS